MGASGNKEARVLRGLYLGSAPGAESGEPLLNEVYKNQDPPTVPQQKDLDIVGDRLTGKKPQSGGSRSTQDTIVPGW